MYCCKWDHTEYRNKPQLLPPLLFKDDMEGTCARNKQSNSIGKRFGQYKIQEEKFAKTQNQKLIERKKSYAKTNKVLL